MPAAIYSRKGDKFVPHLMYPMIVITKSGYLKLTRADLSNNFLVVSKKVILLWCYLFFIINRLYGNAI